MSLLITDAGIAASIQASNLGVSYKITHIAMGASGYAPTHNQTSLRDEIVRRPITQGSIPALGQLHFEVLFDGDIEYEAREIGYFLEDGTLFAVDSREGDIISIKRSDTAIAEVFDLTLSGSEINTITVEILGAASATERVAGIAKIVTNEQVDEGIDDTSFLTIKKLLRAFDAPYLINKLMNNLWLGLAAKICPVGASLPWESDIAPEGWAIRKGQAFDLVACPKLAKIWPDGMIPDMRGNGFIGKEEGEIVGLFEEGEVKSHGHEGSSVGSTDLGNKTASMSGGHVHGVDFWIAAAHGGTNPAGYHQVGGHFTRNTHKAGDHEHSVSIGSHAHTVMIALFGALKNTINHRKCNWIVRLA
ncbi:phage tail protein [Aliivibrio finisterrensis]|uniref:Phage tail protein n=1 Tax=Aliivibrio finisterrensis TaxID=511998 RepID=A0ABY0I2H2_9GAMM|nr:phage tail protein [Aliivibrio finisterrensis]RYU62184.1 phage tail protein [Aliivibrio finisterrensis]